MSTDRMTYDEWQAEVVRRDCVNGNHEPHRSIRMMSNSLGFYNCECAQVKWVPISNSKEGDE